MDSERLEIQSEVTFDDGDMRLVPVDPSTMTFTGRALTQPPIDSSAMAWRY